ncbi:MAG TPA: hypothetical protein VE111_17465, partial [Bradyrhizobium sp.]|nr:hypothetical protein [Bradyrhizobium sp.]
MFRHDTAKQMLNVHLFFVKWLGCQIVESNLPTSPGVDTLSNAIMSQKPHPNIWLAFGASNGREWVGASYVHAHSFLSGKDKYDYVVRMYHVGTLDVRVKFSDVKLKDDWHPSGGNQFVVADLTGL